MKTLLPYGDARIALGEGCFIRALRADSALLVTDAPRRFDCDRLDAALRELTLRGLTVQMIGQGMWALDFAENRWLNLMESVKGAQDTGFPKDERWLPVYELARLLAAHPAPWEQQPREMVRALLKRYDQPEEMIQYALQAIRGCALLLRKKQVLPSAAAGLLFRMISMADQEAK
jgi:hypothetical protein